MVGVAVVAVAAGLVVGRSRSSGKVSKRKTQNTKGAKDPGSSKRGLQPTSALCTSMDYHYVRRLMADPPRSLQSTRDIALAQQSPPEPDRTRWNTRADLRPRGRRKLALQNGNVEGSEVGKNTALFLEAGVKSPLYVALCPDPPAREEREERRKDERQRGERERGERDERDMREMRKR